MRKKRIVFGILTIAAIAAGWYVLSASSGTEVPPPAFVSARASAAATSQRIVNLTEQVGQAIGRVSDAERSHDRERATVALTEARSLNDDARREAVALTGHLQALAGSIAAFASPARQRQALEVVSAELALAGEYLTYSERLGSFFDALAQSFGSSDAALRDAAARALTLVNDAAQRINVSNVAASAKFVEFDRTP